MPDLHPPAGKIGNILAKILKIKKSLREIEAALKQLVSPVFERWLLTLRTSLTRMTSHVISIMNVDFVAPRIEGSSLQNMPSGGGSETPGLPAKPAAPSHLSLHDDLTTREAAEILGVSLRTAQLWVERGRLRAWKTVGGHRRIARASVEALRTRYGDMQRQYGNPAALPVAASVGGSAASAAMQRAPLQYGDAGRPLRLVALEDDKTIQSLYRIAIGGMPFPTEIRIAADGYDGLLLIGELQPDVVIMDLNLPGMDGFRLLRELDRHAGFGALEILVVSALSQAEIRDRGGIPGNIEVLSKPLAMSRLELFLARSRRRMLDRQHS